MFQKGLRRNRREPFFVAPAKHVANAWQEFTCMELVLGAAAFAFRLCRLSLRDSPVGFFPGETQWHGSNATAPICRLSITLQRGLWPQPHFFNHERHEFTRKNEEDRRRPHRPGRPGDIRPVLQGGFRGGMKRIQPRERGSTIGHQKLSPALKDGPMTTRHATFFLCVLGVLCG